MMTAATKPRPKGDRRQRVRRLAREFGVPVADVPVCTGHGDPLSFLTAWIYDRPALSVVHGPRGGGKSYLSALATHVDSLRYDLHETKILGGSLAQSKQVYVALHDFDREQPGDVATFTAERARYLTGSEISILAASPKSVRGPHVPTLRLDEVDEIPEDLRDAAMGMCMEKHGVRASVSMTSTWHNVAGPMGRLKEQAEASGGKIPWHSFCVFEVLERCPESRSGPRLENCPSCPIQRWCHEDRDNHPARLPKAKRSNGHYTIDSLIQKASLVSLRAFESDYLCRRPRADGVWFPTFGSRNITTQAEYEPRLPVHCSIDSGVFTGAVWFQVWRAGPKVAVTVFADYLSEGLTAEGNARAILDIGRECCNTKVARYSTDPAGGARNPVGPTVIGEYERVGIRPLDRWPVGPVADSLALLEGLVEAADGSTNLLIHPRCKHLITAMETYRRAKRAGQWMDYPEDPLHPSEDLVDALRGGLKLEMPEGRRPAPALRRVAAGRTL